MTNLGYPRSALPTQPDQHRVTELVSGCCQIWRRRRCFLQNQINHVTICLVSRAPFSLHEQFATGHVLQ